MTATALRRLAHAAVMSVAPRAGGRWAADVFSNTRSFAGRPDNVLPLGAQEFAVDGCPGVCGGYLWGESGAPVALLVHGWGADSSSMHSLVAPLRALGYTVAAFDAPAHGVNPGRTATMTEYTAGVAAVLRSLGGVRVVVAHSLGSIAAVSGVVLADVDPACIVLVSPACTLSGVLDRWAPPDMVADDAVRARILCELHVRNGVPVSHWDVRSRAVGLSGSVLVLHDPEDAVVPFADATAVADTLPGTRVEVVAGRGHFSILMAPEVTAAVAAFVAEHGRQAEVTS